MTRIFFATDVHGSVFVFRKFLRVHEVYNCDVLMMCGDLTGKAMVPIVKEKENRWWTAPWGKKEVYKSPDAVNNAIKLFEKRGFYCFFTTPEELAELESNQSKAQELFKKLILERMAKWVQEIEEKIPSDVTVVVSPGNDDAHEIDEILKKSEKIVYPVEKVIELDKRHEMITCEWVNPTPWNTPRECSEEKLLSKLEKEFNRVSNFENLICNFHAPPYGTRLDLAPEIDEKLRVKIRFGTPKMVHVGSKSVRTVIEKYQPLLGLHGHIHESAGADNIGKTICINPGSVYIQGILNAFVIDLPEKPGEKVEFFNVSV